MNYQYHLEVYAVNEDGDDTDKIIKISAYSEESLLEQLHKVEIAKHSYEDKK